MDEVNAFLKVVLPKLSRGEAVLLEDVTGKEFRTSLLGFSKKKVDEYLERVAAYVRSLSEDDSLVNRSIWQSFAWRCGVTTWTKWTPS